MPRPSCSAPTMSAESPLFKVSQKARFSSSSRSLEVVGDNLVVHITNGGGSKVKEYALTAVEVAKEKTGRGGSKEVKLRLQGKVKKYAFPSVADKVTFIDFLEARKKEDALPTLLEDIEEGCRVEVVNTSRADLNGQEGTVVHSDHNANPNKERWQVTMDSNGQTMALKPINLKPITGSAAASAGTLAAGEGGEIPGRRRASSGAFAIAARGGTPLRSKREGGEKPHGDPGGVDRGAGAGAADAGDTSDEYDGKGTGVGKTWSHGHALHPTRHPPTAPPPRRPSLNTHTHTHTHTPRCLYFLTPPRYHNLHTH